MPEVKLKTSISELYGIVDARQAQKGGRGQLDESISPRGAADTEIGGLIGEFAVAQYYSELNGEDIQPNLQMEADDGYDLTINGYTVDVKFNSYSFGDLYFLNEDKFKADIGMLVIPKSKMYREEEHPIVRLAGWVTRKEFLAQCLAHEPPWFGEKRTTWQGVGMTQPGIDIRHCQKCSHHHSPINRFKTYATT